MCGADKLIQVLDLGHQALTGVFPKAVDDPVTVGPLQLVWCRDCSLLQLAHSFSLDEMYGWNYGYRSGLNRSMVDHLHRKAHELESRARLRDGDVVVDIGSNDGTLLAGYRTHGMRLIGIDPTGSKFAEFYPDDALILPEFFSADLLNRGAPSGPIRLVTSVAMFYDLEQPVDFARQISEIIAADGLWHFPLRK